MTPTNQLRILARAGWIASSNATYATARAGSGLAATVVDFTHLPRAGQRLSGGVYTCYETFLEFDTRILADVDIETIVLRGMVGQAHDATPTDFSVEARLLDWGATIDTADWVAGDSLYVNPLVATLDTSLIQNSQLEFNSFADVALEANLNRSGYTRLILSSDRMLANIAPAGDEYEEMLFYGAGYVFDLLVTVAGWKVLEIDRSTPTAWVESTGSVYATARSGSSLIVYNGTLAYNRVGQALITGNYYLHQAMLAFDTSELDGADVAAAFLETLGYDNESAADFNIQARIHDWGATIDTADWVAGSSLATKPLVGTLSTLGYAVGVYQRFVDGTGGPVLAAALNKTGVTRMLLASDRLTNGNAPAGLERVTFYARQTEGAPPRLVVIVNRPDNDDFANASDIPRRSAIVTAATAGATPEALEQAGAGDPGFMEDPRTSFPARMSDAAYGFEDDVLYLVGGYGTDSVPTLMPDLVTEIPHASSGGGGNLGSVIAIDAATGIATKLADLPELDASTWVYESGVRGLGALCIGDAGGVIIDGTFYVTGGYTNYLGTNPDTPDVYGALSTSDPNHVNSGGEIDAPSQITMAVDLSTGVATRVADKPCASGYVAAVAYQGKGYFIGGYTGGNNYPYIDIYDPALDSWDRSSLGLPISEGAVVLHDGKIYILDGDNYTWTGSPPDVGSDPTAWEAAATTYFNGKAIVYDIALDSWSIGAANDNYAGYGTFFAFERDGEFVINGSDPLVTLFAYNPTGNTWRILDETLDRERLYQAGGVRSDGMVYEFGGVNNAPETPSLERPHGPAGDTLWWKWTAQDDGMLRVRAEGPGVVKVGVWTGSTIPDLVLRGGALGASPQVFVAVLEGETYYIQLESVTPGVATLRLSSTRAPGTGWPTAIFDALPI